MKINHKLFNELFHGNLRTVFEQINVGISYKNDPYDTYDWILKICESNKIELIYFILLCSGTKYDKNILPYNDVMRNLLKKLNTQSNVGLHPSYHTSENTDLSSSLSLKWDRVGTIATNNSTLNLSNIGIINNKKLNIIDRPTTISNNDISLLYSRSLALASSPFSLSLQSVGLRNNRVLGVVTNNVVLTTNGLLYKYYRLNLNNSSIALHLQNVVNKHSYLLNLQSSSTSLSIKDVVLGVLDPFAIEEVFILVGDTSTLLSTVAEDTVLVIADTKIIDTTYNPKLIETLEDKLLSTTHKVTLINITSKD